MLLNPTHEITLSGLPSEVLDAYVRYKKGTRAIVAWVVQYAPSHYAGARSLPIKELARLAGTLAGKIKHLPDVIHFHFRETIAARKKLSKYFRGHRDQSLEDVDTVNHEHFTTSLTKIYADLCACCEKPRQSCETKKMSDSDSPTQRLANLYAGLQVEDVPDWQDSEFPQALEECSACQIDTVYACPGPAPEMLLADDDLGNAIEYASALQEIYDVVQAVEQSWTRAGRGETHFVAAAFATNVAYASLLQIERKLRDLNEDICLSELQERCCALLEQTSDDGQTSNWHSLLQKLASVQQAFEHHTENHLVSMAMTTPPPMQRVTDYMRPSKGDATTTELDVLPALITNILHLIRSKETPCAIVRNSTPSYADLGYLVFHPENKNSKLRLSFSLHLLSQSYASYVLALAQPILVTKCRVAALKLAQSASQTIDSLLGDKNCFPCRCTQTIAFHLHHLGEDLTAFAKYKRWDLYFQSPYVSGNHILEILDLCHYYGTKLFVYRHYIGALLHSYNVLRQLAGLEEIPLLEYLCNEFKDSFFPGGQRPTKSFRSCWTRYIGARIKFKKGHRRNHKESWCMAIPPHAARRAAGLGVGRDTDGNSEKDECLIFKIKQQDYGILDDQWPFLETPTSPKKAVGSIASASLEPSHQHRMSRMLGMLQRDLIGSASDGSHVLPRARLNYFKVFEDCVRIVSQISDSTHTAAKEKGMNCICFASAILEGGDRIVDARSMGKVDRKGSCWKIEEREGVLKETMGHMKDVLGCKEVGHWQWEL